MMTKKRGWKKAITDRARQILNAVKIGETITGDDDSFLRELIQLHHESESKIGVGIRSFEVRRNEWNGRTFWLIRHDGTETDFSFMKAITPPSPLQDFIKACRTAVIDDVLEFKQTAFSASATITCPITGEIVTWKTAHVDHAPPFLFDIISKEFAEVCGDFTGFVEPTRDGELTTRFRDQNIVDMFVEFHKRRAVLRIVSVTANLSVLKRKG